MNKRADWLFIGVEQLGTAGKFLLKTDVDKHIAFRQKLCKLGGQGVN